MKKLISCVLAVAMLLMCLVGCNNISSTQNTTESPKETAGEGTTEAPVFSQPSSDESTEESTEAPTEPVAIKAAMCKVDITPEGDVYLQGYSDGDAVLANKPDDFLTDLMARVLILDVDGERIVHINFELNYIGLGTNTSKTFRYDVADAAGAKSYNVYVSHSNSHQTNPMVSAKTESAIVDAVKTAAENLVPVKMGVDTYGTEYGISRSPAFSMSHTTPYDNTVTVLRFDNAETDAPVGMIYCVPMIQCTFGLGDSANWDKLMCEFTGLTSRYLEEQFADNAGFTAMYLNGFLGNGVPYFPETDKPFEPDFNKLKGFAGDFGAEIMECYNGITCEDTVGVEMNLGYNNYDLKKAMTQAHNDSWGSNETVTLTLNTISVGDVAYIDMNAAPFTTIGAHLRAESPFEYLIGASMIDHGYVGFVPLAETFRDPNEAEIAPWRTAFDETGEKQFLDSALDALCKLKGVTYERTMTTQTAATEQDGKRVYTFAFAEEITPDKLVLCFDQSSRLNCAEDFVLEVFDSAGNKTHTIEMTDNSVNYLGFSVENVKAATVVLTVSSTYRADQVANIEVSLHAMNFTPAE